NTRTAASTGTKQKATGRTWWILNRRTAVLLSGGPDPAEQGRPTRSFWWLVRGPHSLRSLRPTLLGTDEPLGHGPELAVGPDAGQRGRPLGDQGAVPEHLVAVLQPHRTGARHRGPDGQQVVVVRRAAILHLDLRDDQVIALVLHLLVRRPEGAEQ